MPQDLPRIRLDNALALFDEFVSATIKHADAATLRGLERRFAERLQIQPSYWSQIKSRSRQIGDRLARQFEQLSHKPNGWMDQPHTHGSMANAIARPLTAPLPTSVAVAAAASSPAQPQDDDERFIVGLVLTYYRRHPERARSRLLDLLGEVLGPTVQPPAAPGQVSASTAPAKATPPPDDGRDLWSRTQKGVAPLKRKR